MVGFPGSSPPRPVGLGGPDLAMEPQGCESNLDTWQRAAPMHAPDPAASCVIRRTEAQ